MNINISFDSWEELCDFLSTATATPMARLAQAVTVGDKVLEEAQKVKAAEEAKQETAQEPQEAPKAPKAKKATPKTEKAQDEAPAKAEEPAKAEPEPDEKAPAAEEAPAEEITEDFRIQVRKTLAALNKKTGKNTASELIADIGATRLADVPLADLPGLMKKAEEVLNG